MATKSGRNTDSRRSRASRDATITLEQPIVHAPSGPGTGFVRGQRYTSLAALKRQPRTTAELLRYQREN
jgi:hypothetical protein